jgi:hypothetical protein
MNSNKLKKSNIIGIIVLVIIVSLVIYLIHSYLKKDKVEGFALPTTLPTKNPYQYYVLMINKNNYIEVNGEKSTADYMSNPDNCIEISKFMFFDKDNKLIQSSSFVDIKTLNSISPQNNGIDKLTNYSDTTYNTSWIDLNAPYGAIDTTSTAQATVSGTTNKLNPQGYKTGGIVIFNFGPDYANKPIPIFYNWVSSANSYLRDPVNINIYAGNVPYTINLNPGYTALGNIGTDINQQFVKNLKKNNLSRKSVFSENNISLYPNLITATTITPDQTAIPPTSATSEPIRTTPPPTSATSEPIRTTPPPTSATSEPIRTTPPPTTTTTEPIRTTPPPTTTTTEPIRTTPPPTTSTITGTPSPTNRVAPSPTNTTAPSSTTITIVPPSLHSRISPGMGNFGLQPNNGFNVSHKGGSGTNNYFTPNIFIKRKKNKNGDDSGVDTKRIEFGLGEELQPFLSSLGRQGMGLDTSSASDLIYDNTGYNIGSYPGGRRDPLDSGARNANVSAEYERAQTGTCIDCAVTDEGMEYSGDVDYFDNITRNRPNTGNNTNASSVSGTVDSKGNFIHSCKMKKFHPGYQLQPPTCWDVPQKRPPVCLSDKKCMPAAVFDSGLSLNALQFDTAVGSIMPGFTYVEHPRS